MVSDGPAATEETWPVTGGDRKRVLTDVLRGVSRAFYLSLKVLPPGLREPVGLAYLLARAADTICDTGLLPPASRLDHLLAFRTQVSGPASTDGLRRIREAMSGGGPTPPERALIDSLPKAFAMLRALPEADRKRVRSVVVTLTRGMELDLKTFPPPADSAAPVALPEPGDLDRYVYLAAGCVGEFWTTITAAHSPSLGGWDVEGMSELGVRFGKALQMTNVLRDLPRDLRLGRCYLPRSELSAAGLVPGDLLAPSNAARARPVLVRHLNIALGHYEAAGRYILSIPRRSPRLRLAALWPVLIGLATLALLARNTDWLDPDSRAKVPRARVYRMVALSLPAVFSNSALRAWIGRLRKEVTAAL